MDEIIVLDENRHIEDKCRSNENFVGMKTILLDENCCLDEKCPHDENYHQFGWMKKHWPNYVASAHSLKFSFVHSALVND